jgi:phospholipid/cholesterol/gamma-HCH transport system substrate-binding protein
MKANQVIPLTQTEPAVDLTVLFAGFQPLFQGLAADQINQLSGEIITALQGEGGSLDLLLGSLASLTNTLADKDHIIGEVVDNLTSVLTAVGSRDAELSNLIVQLQGFVSGLAQDRGTIGAAIDGINNLATSTSGLLRQVRAPFANDITELTGLVGNLNAGSDAIKYVIQNLAPTVGGLIRTASYGSWFNFYLCKVTGTITLPGGTQKLHLGLLPKSAQARCN